MRPVQIDLEIYRENHPVKPFTKQQLSGRRSLKETIAINTFTPDEAIVLLSYLEQYEPLNMMTGKDKESFEVRPREHGIVSPPLPFLGLANYYQLRYKLENLIDAKFI